MLKPGAKSPSVYVLQLMLSEIAPHYNRIAAVPLTGEYDSDTQVAVRRAQQIFQLPQTGLTDRATWRRWPDCTMRCSGGHPSDGA